MPPQIGRELAPEAEWEIWYQDSFDWECPRQVDLAGRGLVQGLVELWARHLFETVQPDGRRGFSRFNLWWKQGGRSLAIAGEWAGLVRLRQWVFGSRQHAARGYVQAGDKKLLLALAAAHCRLVMADQTSEAILAAASTAASRQDLETQLLRLTAGT
jgi:hypothetical protein